MLNPMRNINPMANASKMPRIHRPMRTWPSPGITKQLAQMATVNPMFSRVSSRAAGSVSDGAFGEFSFNITNLQAYNLEYFVSTLFSHTQQHAGTRYSQQLCDEFNRSLVRSSVDGWRAQSKDPFSSLFAL